MRLTYNSKEKKQFMLKEKQKYDEYMDAPCISLCDAINSLPGIVTTESCCGHLNGQFMVFADCNDLNSLAILARAFNRRYSGTNLLWKVEIETADSPKEKFPTFTVFIHTEQSYISTDQMEKDISQLCENIEYWKQPEFSNIFNYNPQKYDNDFELIDHLQDFAGCIGKHYRHFKGGEYKIIEVARHSETNEPYVVYKNVKTLEVYVRPAAMFFEHIERPEIPYSGPRFAEIK